MADDLTGSAAPGEVAAPPPAKPAKDGTEARRRDLSLGTIAGKYGLLIFFGAVLIVFSLARPHTFPTGENAEAILTLAAPALIMAVGLTVVLVMQDFDLSFGAMIGLAGGAVTTFIVTDHMGFALAIILVVLMGAAAAS